MVSGVVSVGEGCSTVVEPAVSLGEGSVTGSFEDGTVEAPFPELSFAGLMLLDSENVNVASLEGRLLGTFSEASTGGNKVVDKGVSPSGGIANAVVVGLSELDEGATSVIGGVSLGTESVEVPSKEPSTSGTPDISVLE